MRRRSRMDVSTFSTSSKRAIANNSGIQMTKQHHNVSIDRSGFERVVVTVPNVQPVNTPRDSVPQSSNDKLQDETLADKASYDHVTEDELAHGEELDRELEVHSLGTLVSAATTAIKEKQKRKRTQAVSCIFD